MNKPNTHTITSHIRAHAPTILVIDESIDTIVQINNALSSEGYIVLTARDADSILTHLHRVLPVLVLIDATSSRLNGFELGRWIKSMPIFRRIPVLFMTERTNTDQIVGNYTNGGNDYITKPLRIPELLTRVVTQVTTRNSGPS
jgi:DNA-binding response OmpR family regulator